MSKNILVVTSSPRNNSNTTILAEAFREGAASAGHMVDWFDVTKTRIDMCLACNACWGKGKACIVNDGFNTFVDKLKKADVLVIASPVYWGSFPAPLKALVDKMYAFCMPWCSLDISGKQTVLLTCGDGDDDSAFDLIKASFNGLVGLMEWKEPKVIAIPKLSEAGEVNETDGPDRAKQLGREI